MTEDDSETLEPVPETVLQDLTCPLCGGLFRDAYTSSECLHSCLFSFDPLFHPPPFFPPSSPNHPTTAVCKICAYHHFAETPAGADHRCPVCRVELGANPLDALLQDAALQSVVDTLFPHFAADERRLEAELRHSTAAPDDSAATVAASAPALDPRKIVQGTHYSDRVAFALVPLPGSDSDCAELRLPKPYVATTGRATVRQVVQFLVHALHTAHGTTVRPEQVCFCPFLFLFPSFSFFFLTVEKKNTHNR